MRKYRKSLKEGNYNMLRFFFLLLFSQQTLQLVLHLVYTDDLKEIPEKDRDGHYIVE